MPAILRPRALRSGDLVAVAALSGGLEEADEPLLGPGINVIEQMGFGVQVSPLVDIGRHWWWGAAQPEEIAGRVQPAASGS